jgi:hypothetical protein
VVDEADKAPLEVVALLKGLLEDGFMRLGDGRVLRRSEVGTISICIFEFEGAEFVLLEWKEGL